DQLPLQERIRLAQEALAKRPAPRPVLLKTLRIPRATGNDRKKRREAEKKRRKSERAPAAFEGLTTKYERPKATLHPDPGRAFLSHAWVGHLLLEEGQRRSYRLRRPKVNPIVESFFSRFKEGIKSFS
ncbi:hypothetical protein AB1399_00945, partial [Hydrogenibacillus schlegelii]|uniref:hypothetical protein n=1 Tax=Hydrogenibacillus schlegelii TaxID=1484 RepID=UPI0034A0929B